MPGIMFLLLTRQADANPTGLSVQSGTASLSINGSQLTVTAGNNAVLNWQSFNIASGETTIFSQPSAASIAWNHINDQNPSQIYGSLQANGVVVLLNSSGFYFGPNSFVSAAGLVVSTANYGPPQNAGGAWVFNGPPPLASIVNFGQIKIGHGGDCFLIADQVVNHGDIEAPGGNIGLAAGQTVTLSERPDGRGMSMKVKLPQGAVDNYGNLIADGGTISLHASVVNQDGLIQANSVQNKNGVIELVASDQLNLGVDSKILAQGDNSIGGSAGGNVMLKSQNSFSDATGSEISVAGGANGGNGGAVEISAPVMPAIHSVVDGRAQAGSTGGQLLLDPDYIILDTSGGDPAPDGTVGVGDSPGGTLYLNVNSVFLGFSAITLQANYDITVADYTRWNLSASTGQTAGKLVLEAGGNIMLGTASAISDANSWSMQLFAGVTDFLHQTVQPGLGSISLDSSQDSYPSYLRTASGAISLVAGSDITLGLGYVNTTAGGSISAHALLGNIDTGAVNRGYSFRSAASASQGYYVRSYVGGISTLAGGDVNLTAGGNVTSLLPSMDGYYYDGTLVDTQGSVDGTPGSGAYGNQPGQRGDVNIVAGGNVIGHYLVANGTGNIFAGVTMGTDGNPVKDASGNYVLGGAGSAGTDSTSHGLALSLISGGWNVDATRNIYLQEVRNPNGIFNTSGYNDNVPPNSLHAFDYAPSDFVNLTAGNLVQLGSPVLPRDRTDEMNIPVIYPSILSINAGAGGVILNGDSVFNQLVLFPSPQGSLTINTTGGGGLISTMPTLAGAPQIFNLVVSDSGSSQYTLNTYFGIQAGIVDHAPTPIHLGHPTAIKLNISGNMSLVSLIVPEAAQINVVGDMNNCRFQGMNLNTADTTSITVGQNAKINMENSGILNPATDGSLKIGGDINNRSAFTSVDLSKLNVAVPDLSVLSRAYGNVIGSTAIDAITLASSFFYNPDTKEFTYQNITLPGVTLGGILRLLQNLTVAVIGPNGKPALDINGNPITQKVAVIDAATANALLAEYNRQGPVPSDNGGYVIGGGGKFQVDAKSMDLGTTAGIQSKGVAFYGVNGVYPLASLFSLGADIGIKLSGDLTMYSSAIATLNGSSISINAGGNVNVGSSAFTVKALGTRGIFTTGLGDVSAIADGNINVNGSRIAAYNGGDVTVESLNGDVNAGTGGSGFVVVNAYSVKGGKVTSSQFTIPGSGILATTFPREAGRVVGNILVEAPNGNVNASAGGIVQLPLNGVNTADSMVEVLAGLELRDSSGHALSAADIASGTPVEVSAGKNIDASGSGVVGSTVKLKATGSVTGVIFARDNLDISAQQNVNVTALASGQASISAGGSISGTIIGVGGVSASGSSIDANLESNAGISGETSGSKGMGQGSAAAATSVAASANEAGPTAAKTDSNTEEDPSKKKKNISLARKVSRVTVLLPAKN